MVEAFYFNTNNTVWLNIISNFLINKMFQYRILFRLNICMFFFSKIKCFNHLDMEYILVNWVNRMSFLFWLFFLNVKHFFSFFFWPLYCLSFDFRLMIILLVFSNLSCVCFIPWLFLCTLKGERFLLILLSLLFKSRVEGGGGCPINRFNLTAFLCLSQARTWIYNIICHGLFSVQWVKMWRDCSFCWYCWNC